MPIVRLRIVLLLLVSTLFAMQMAGAQSINLTSGNVHFAELETSFGTANWAGLRILNSGTNLQESTSSFASLTLNTAAISVVQFPGDNLKDNLHYYVASLVDGLSLPNIQSVNATALEPNETFHEIQFPLFYPGYESKNDNPNKTFCCTTTNITIGGTNFTALQTTLSSNINYYLLNYNDTGNITPIFFVDFRDATCFNSSSCVAQFMLPLSNSPYYFHALSQTVSYSYRIFVDGTETTAITQTGLPYNLTVEVNNTTTGLPEPNASVVVAESDGRSLFIPYRLSGYFSLDYSVGLTGEDGRETFLVAPTPDPTVTNYSIYVGVLLGDAIGSQEQLSVTNQGSLVQQSKVLTPSTLYDNAKVTVNAMNQIVNFLFRHASTSEIARQFQVVYDTTYDNFTIYQGLFGEQSSLDVKTGTPHVISVNVTTSGVEQNGYTARLVETSGYVLMNPYTASTPLNLKSRTARQEFPTATNTIVSATSLGVINSNVSIQILNPTGTVIATYYADLDPTLSVAGDALSYSDDTLKTVVNRINQLVSSLFYALNN